MGKHLKKQYWRRACVVLVMMVTVISFTACKTHGDSDTETAIETAGENIQVMESVDSEDTVDLDPNPEVGETGAVDDLSIDTPYGVIRFPYEFSDYINIEIEDTEEYYRVIFGCKYQENNISLFNVTFGEAEEDAQVIGQIIDTEDVAKDVSVSMYELTMDTDWEEENAELLYSMQETINFVMENFESSYEFRPVS